MGKSQKPRHAKRRTWIPRVPWMTRSTVDRISGLLADVELMATSALPFGLLTFDQANSMRELLNLGAALFVLDNALLDKSWADHAEPIILDAQSAFHSWYARGCAAGAENDPTVRFVAKGPEISSIQNGFALAGALVQSRLNDAPMHVVDVHFALHEITSDRRFARHTMTHDELCQKVRRLIERTNATRLAARMEGVNL